MSASQQWAKVTEERCDDCGRPRNWPHAVTCPYDPSNDIGRCSRCKGPRSYKGQGYCAKCLSERRAILFSDPERRAKKRSTDLASKRLKAAKQIAAVLRRAAP